MRISAYKYIGVMMGTAALMSLSSCVNEWPKGNERQHGVTLHVVCDTEWLPDYDYEYTRAENMEIKYIFQVYKKGSTTEMVKETSVFSYDFDRNPFDVALSLYPGDYDVYVWSDVCNAETGESLYYETSNFARISYTLPYVGDTDYKDAFRGMASLTVADTDYIDQAGSQTIELSRPLARYIFISTDLDTFVDEQVTRGKLRSVGLRGDDNYASILEEELDGYTVKINYPLYMPSVFDNFLDRPVDSWTGMSFTGGIKPINEDEATVGLDYVMMNGGESFVQVSMEVYDDDGVKVAGTPTLNIPTLRNRTTLVYGKFLTTNADAGVTINPDFDGQFNIEYK